ncbi:hypothetical protein [Picrophilus oshimae]|uniref:Hypothetical membrane protein n=1 Tax=Picrophilus torridus (strain ATCC 700027 / DSM 9790 / JCM 10055 / NBRC 100828 / KAW 2/3) TaxID=1122961 RepID=Q6L0H7_PICTO|nr:hypothetical protein [Picrophilus oshimae]AAT43525.1 hypothetical membrane protein [Picrophilus oshimae DSM 9789]SMD30163.1 hypothetical protein SAMN02745355_0024 [Picrophilus oshimae DSM 9789]
MADARLRYGIAILGSLIIIISALITLLGIFIAGFAGFAQLITFNPAGFPLIGAGIISAIIPVIWIVLAYIIYRIASTGGSHGRAANGFAIIVLAVLVFVLGGGFVIGPLLCGIAGILLII